MACPNCGNEMRKNNIDNQTVYHCDKCGGSFFEENGINRISENSANALSLDKQNEEISGSEKHCPKDNTLLKTISNEKNIPSTITLLQCSLCKGIFAYPDDLIKFKLAQNAKLNYFKAWDIPLPSLQSILVLTFVGIISIAGFSSYMYLQKGSVQQSQAQDMIKKINISRKGEYLFISFNTALPYKSTIFFRDSVTGKTTNKIISGQPSLIHYVITSEINFDNTVYYQIVLEDKEKNKLETEEKRLMIENR